MPITLSQTSHLAAVATLYGLSPPSIATANVLELGCAAGGNIIPLAVRYPRARFTGIDLAASHIADGRRQIGALGLDNVTLHRGDLADILQSREVFDYIVCHGVYSWVPPDTRMAILRICRERLSPNGVATISYNVYPGWHLRDVIRDICLEHAGSGAAYRRVERARAALDGIAQSSSADGPYGALLREEAKRLRRMPAAYILGEFLAPHNAPCRVRDFIDLAGRQGLHYVGEADLAMPAASAHAGQGRAAAEQHDDFITGRPFRRSVLVRRELAGQCLAAPDAERLALLHVCGTPARTNRADGEPEDAAVVKALERLSAAYPATIVPDGAEPGVRPALLRLATAGQLMLSVEPYRGNGTADARPLAWPVARMEAASGQPWLTSLRHEAIPAHPLVRTLLPCLDGTHDLAALREVLKAAMIAGTVRVPELAEGPPVAARGDLDSISNSYCVRILRFLARKSLLEARGSRD